jgi:hypothetical protein
LFSMVNWGSIWKERLLTVSVFNVKHINFVPNSLFQVNGENL